MGLDIVFIRVKHRDLSEGQEVEDLADDKRKSIACFRKVNFLLPFFDYEDNCSYKEVTKEQVEDLVNACEIALKYKPKEKDGILTAKEEDELGKILPTQDGFFFGNVHYDQWYFSDVKAVMKKFKPMLERKWWNDSALFMWCWW